MPRLFHKTPAFLACSALGALLVSCLPPGESGQCQTDEECTGRGQVCDVDNSICIDTEWDASSTENPAPQTFTNKVVPFFRGQVCAPTDIKAGSEFPVQMTPCFHPCITVNSFKFKHFFECTGSVCSAWAVMWVEADGDACPADAFSEFDTSQCNFLDPPIEFTVTTTLDTGPIIGTMAFEIPFLTNADMAQLAPDGTDSNPETSAIKARIFQYPQDSSRLLNDGQPLSLLDNHPLPPPSCTEPGCECFNIGY